MRIDQCALYRLKIPFKRSFKHAAAERFHNDAIIVEITTDTGVIGYGEIQARPYVTGENNDEIWDSHAPKFARRLLSCEVASSQDVYNLLWESDNHIRYPALIGGFDLALLDCLELGGRVSWTEIIGPARKTATTKCLTIGGDYSGAELKNQARFARLGGYRVVKLKVSCVEDASRVRDLRQWIGSDIALRLDANGEMVFAEIFDLLERCATCNIESVEEPLHKSTSNLGSQLRKLHATTGVDLMADESICSEVDLARFKPLDAYQIVNIRIGKCGGLSGAINTLRAAIAAGYSVVCGTMVGETSVMLRASNILLAHCDDLAYVEGIDQAKKLLESQAIDPIDDDAHRHFRWNPEVSNKYIVGRQIAK